jgi:hypothetical protein
MWNETYSLIRQEVGLQEQLLWSGQPGRGLALRSGDVMMIPFSLIWGGFAIFWEYIAIRSNDPFMWLWGIPFVLYGLHLIVGRFFVDAWRRERTTYGVTRDATALRRGIWKSKARLLLTANVKLHGTRPWHLEE